MEEVKIYSRPWETDGSVQIIRIEGFLDTTTSRSLAKKLDELIDQEAYKIVIDLEAVDYISSPGWGIMVGDIRRIRENGGDLKLARLKPEVYEIYTLLGLDSFIESYDSVEEACARFAELPLAIEQPIEANLPEEEIAESVGPEESKELMETVEVREISEVVSPVAKRRLSLIEMVQEIIEEHPTYNTWKVKRELDTERYNYTRASWFKVYRELRRLRTRHLLAEERRLKIERNRIEEMRTDFDAERRLWEMERKLKIQKDELEREKRKLEGIREEFEKDREKFREEMRHAKAELRKTIRIEKARQAKLMSEIQKIVRAHPEYGAKRISEALQTDYFVSRSPSTIYSKLKRADLNTKEKRLRFIEGEMEDAEVQS